MKSELSIIKIKCDHTMVGQDIIIPASQEGQDLISTFPYAEKMACAIKYKFRHNLDRHDLFFACVNLVSENTEKSEMQIREQCKIDCRWIQGYTYYEDKNKNKRVNVITKSIAFSQMTLQEANEFYSKAFDMLASYIGIPTDQMIDEAKKRMKNKKYCKFCGKVATVKHHKFSRTKWALNKYGKRLINAEFNLIWTCFECNSSHSNIPKEYIWTEKKFVSEAMKAGYYIDDNIVNKIINTFQGEVINGKN